MRGLLFIFYLFRNELKKNQYYWSMNVIFWLSYEVEIAFLKVKTFKFVIMKTTLLWTSLHNVTTSKYVN